MAIVIHPNGKGYRVRYHYPAMIKITTSGNTSKVIHVRDIPYKEKGSEGLDLNRELSALLRKDETIVRIETIDAYGKTLDDFVSPEGSITIPEE
jgi:hypothetical protein